MKSSWYGAGWRPTDFLAWFLITLALSACSLLVRALLGVWFPSVVPFAMTFPAVLAATLMCGRYAGFICLAITQIGAWYLFLPPAFSFDFRTPSDAVSLIISTLSALVLIVFADRHLKTVARGAERKVLADIVEGTDAFVQVADLDYRWLAINKASADEFERIFGKRPRPGDNMLELLSDRPEHAAAVKAVWSRALAGEEFIKVDTFGDNARERRWYEMKFNVLRGQDGRQTGAFQFVYDVTERVRDQERLAEADTELRQVLKLDAMGQLTGGVAHDFNNLLTPIIGALDTLHRRKVGGEREQRLLVAALQSGERARTLVQRLLAFARRQPLCSPAPSTSAV
jgi:PAS domain S-box-containing protein